MEQEDKLQALEVSIFLNNLNLNKIQQAMHQAIELLN